MFDHRGKNKITAESLPDYVRRELIPKDLWVIPREASIAKRCKFPSDQILRSRILRSQRPHILRRAQSQRAFTTAGPEAPRPYKYFTGMTLSSSLRVIRLSYMQTTPPGPRSAPGILSRTRKADMSFVSGSACFLISMGQSVWSCWIRRSISFMSLSR